MNASRTNLVLRAVESVLKDNLDVLGDVKTEEIGILPERKVPASSGQQFITISAEKLTAITPYKLTRKMVVEFTVSVSRRMRDQPNDRFEMEAWTDPDAMVEIHENIDLLLESNLALTVLETMSNDPLYQLPDDYTEDPILPGNRPSIWAIHGNSFSFHSLNTDPEHLYPSDYLTRGTKKVRGVVSPKKEKDEIYEKIAGYRMTAHYEAPAISRLFNPMECRPLYEPPEE